MWSWIQWTTGQFGLPAPLPEQWELSGTALVEMTEEDFVRRAPQVNAWRNERYFVITINRRPFLLGKNFPVELNHPDSFRKCRHFYGR